MPPSAFYSQRSVTEPDTLFQLLSNHFGGDGRLFGVQVSSLEARGVRRSKPKISDHVEVRCQAHYEKATEKDPQVLSVSVEKRMTSLEVRKFTK